MSRPRRVDLDAIRAREEERKLEARRARWRKQKRRQRRNDLDRQIALARELENGCHRGRLLKWYETLTKKLTTPEWEFVESKLPARIRTLLSFERQAFGIRIKLKTLEPHRRRGSELAIEETRRLSNLLSECRRQIVNLEFNATINDEFDIVESVVDAVRRKQKGREPSMPAR